MKLDKILEGYSEEQIREALKRRQRKAHQPVPLPEARLHTEVDTKKVSDACLDLSVALSMVDEHANPHNSIVDFIYEVFAGVYGKKEADRFLNTVIRRSL